ncbi:DsrE family protein [Rhodoferax sp.]|uniref:DsrE family protein n=1 Tax=Rhodoferax sp. TaxID=50421 RepID=UPI0027159845|nr:DsrE family protein [Rhodoferax sp.]MDO9197942.1 DsrE family protein [Rhodoferax sp.]
MNRKAFIQASLLAFVATLATGAIAQAADAAPKAKVVFQVSDGDTAKWNLAFNNAKNVQQELGADKVDIEIVAYGPGIGMLKADAPVSNRVTEATQSGMKIVACENTMKGQKLTKADMNTAIGYVPAGVVEIMKRQGEGWAYIRP